MSEFFRPTVANINSNAVRNNIHWIREKLGSNKYFCCMVKANAYGHGDVLISQICQEEGVNALGVISIEEAQHLRQNGITIEILLFSPFENEHLAKIEELKLTPVVSSLSQLELLSRSSLSSSISYHLEFNTGMNRFGVSYSDVEKAKEISLNTASKLAAICTHFLNGEDFSSDQGFTQKQLEKFKHIKSLFSEIDCFSHAYNSFSFILANETSHLDIVDGIRLGISLYGIQSDVSTQKAPLEPVLELVSKVVDVQKVAKGEVVSYGPTWQANQNSLIGVVPIGYADGYHRLNSNRAQMLFRGKKVPQVGTICMDYTMVDLSEVIDENEISAIINNEEIKIIGQQGEEEISANQVASWSETISYEVLTSLSARVPRIRI